MMDIVYILGTGSKWNNNELRYSLRSLEKHLTWYRYVYVIGEKPAFLSDKVIHIPATDVGSNKEECIMNKIMIACEHPDVSENFALMNDDYIFQQNIRADFPFYYQKGIAEFFKRDGHYRNALDNTFRVLTENNLPTKYFDIHVPIVYNKSLFPQVMAKYNWGAVDGYVIRSLYCNTLKIEGLPWTDCKVYGDLGFDELLQLLAGQPIFSFDDTAVNDALFAYLDNLYPKPSVYESGTDEPKSINSIK